MNLTATTKAIQRQLGFTGRDVDGTWGPDTAGATLRALDGGEVLEPPADDEWLDKRTKKNLATLEPRARVKFLPFVKAAKGIAASMGCELKVICGHRNRADQAKAVRDGASRASYGFSWHNYGIAIDYGLFKGRSYVDGDNPDLAWTIYSAIGEIADDHGMEWGGSWSSFVDSPHFHIDTGPSTPTARDRRKLFRGDWSF